MIAIDHLRPDRITRANVLSLREKEFVEAARALGAGSLYVAALVVLPNCLSPLIVQGSLGWPTIPRRRCRS